MSLFKAPKILFTFICLLILVVSCDISKNRVDLTLYEVERNQRALRKVSEFDLIEQGYRSGKLLADSSQAYFWATIETTLSQNDSLFSCDEVIFPNKKGDFSIDLMGVDKSKDDDLPSLILQSYLDKEIVEPSLESLDNQQYLYSQPLWFDEQKCLSCHQQKSKGKGALAGIWSIQLSKKYLVLEIPAVKD